MERVKYPRTLHLPWSPGICCDDKVLDDLSALEAAAEVVLTLKMDGESTTIYPDGHVHARSVDSGPHPSRSYVRRLAGRVAHDLPPGLRLCGENLYAVHSIRYTDLADHFLLYNVWQDDVCLSWADTVTWAGLLGLATVPEVHRGPWPGRDGLDALFAPHADRHEGFVVRRADAFPAAEFGRSVAKWVRPSHVQTDQHWMTQQVEVNRLAPPGPPFSLGTRPA